jgi:hypothetical protein
MIPGNNLLNDLSIGELKRKLSLIVGKKITLLVGNQNSVRYKMFFTCVFNNFTRDK